MTCRQVVAVLLAGGALTAAVLVAGGYNVSAAAGHLRPVAAVLHWTMQNSVTLRAGAAPPDDLRTDARARAGASHYDLVCRDCHGAPGIPLSAVATSLEPPPPHILDTVQRWDPAELFWIIKHGIKMTAMPAWPAQHRDDEVWSVVAFLLRLPEMNAADYRGAVLGPLADGQPPPIGSAFEAELARCARCHGYDGRGARAAALPRLDGQTETYLLGAMQAFARRQRSSGIMQVHAIAAGDRHFEALARYYARAGESASGPRQAPVGLVSADSALSARGERLARVGDTKRGIPACAACHGPVSYPRADSYPNLSGQPAAYLEMQLRLFRAGQRGGSAFSNIMHMAAEPLEDQDIAALAVYYATGLSGSSRR